MAHNVILQLITRLLIPVIFVFAFYVQFHGDYSPGGGFQAGVIFSSAMVLYALVFGLDQAADVLSNRVLIFCACGGVLLYTVTGLFSVMKGGEFLNYSLLASDPVAGQHIGILIIEFGIGVTVASVMLLIFFTFARRMGV